LPRDSPRADQVAPRIYCNCWPLIPMPPIYFLGMSLFKRVAVATSFGVVISLTKVLMPTPLDKVVIFPQALLLTIAYLAVGAPGATYTGLVGGLLTALWRAAFAPLTVAFAVAYGALIDALCYCFGVPSRAPPGYGKRIVAAVTAATVIIGLASYYVTVHVLALLPRNPMLEVAILVAGTVNGLAAGAIAASVWSRLRVYVP